MTEEQAARIERKLDEIIEVLPTIHAMGKLLVWGKTVTDKRGLNENTLSRNEKIVKFQEIGHRKIYIELKDIFVVRNRKRKHKR